jgi:hypothetical protein
MTATAVVFAYHNVGVRCLALLLSHGVQVMLVLTHGDNAGETIWLASVEKLARAHALPVITPADANDPAVVARIGALRPDFLFSFYYATCSTELLAAPARRIQHARLAAAQISRAAPVNWAVIMGSAKPAPRCTRWWRSPMPAASSIRKRCPSARRTPQSRCSARSPRRRNRCSRALPGLSRHAHHAAGPGPSQLLLRAQARRLPHRLGQERARSA